MTDRVKAKHKILVVDDEPDNLDLLYRAFRREFTILRAQSGQAALNILAEQQDIAVIISDQRMPGMSGTEFLSLTATQYPDIIRIILTGYTDVEDLVEAINSGKVFKYVTKPWEDGELREVVNQAIQTHTVLKSRTEELSRTLQQESLLNAVTNTIRSARTYQQILQTVVNTIGQMLEVSCCLLKSFQSPTNADDWFIYQAKPIAAAESAGEAAGLLDPERLAPTIWTIDDVVVIDDVLTDARIVADDSLAGQARRDAYAEQAIRSSLLVPLIFQQQLLAVLALHQRHTSREWHGDEVQLLLMVADQAALALSQAYAYEQAQALARRESLLNTITTAIRSSLDPQDIFAAITQNLGEALQSDGCALSLWTAQDEFVQCVGLYDAADQSGSGVAVALDPNVVTWGQNDEVSDPMVGVDPARTTSANYLTHSDHRSLPQSFAPIDGNPVLLRLLKTQQTVVVDDLSQQPDLNMPDLPLRAPARALLVVPLMSEGAIIGSISLRQNQPRQWLPTDINLAEAVATQAAIAVQQSRLYQTTRQQAEQLLALDRQKNEFFQNISHEFRTPLTLMIGPLEAAIAQQEGLSYDQSMIALRNSRRLLRLVNQLLDLQRLDAGRMQPKFRPHDLAEFVLQIVEAFQPYCDRKQVQLVTDIQPCPAIYLDTEKFDKVLYNLLSNAMKFTAAGGQIAVRLYPDADCCTIQVTDTGIGIRDDQIAHLFERFRQADGSENRSYEGSGLGLALVHELVMMHGGDIEVESVYGEGTTFTVRLKTGTDHLSPEQIVEAAVDGVAGRAMVELADLEADLLARSPAASIPAIAAQVPALQADRVIDPVALEVPPPSAAAEVAVTAAATDAPPADILVVDDNADLRAYVSEILRRSGYNVYGARNGAEGYQVAQTLAPQLIITDLMMPMVSGIEMIQQIRADATLRGTPVILLTAKADEDTRIEGTEQGADAYLSKPFNNRELLAEVRNLLALKATERRVAELNTYLTQSVLSRFLPPSMVDKAAKGELSLDLRPEPKLITILFSDIVGFTQLSNTLRSRKVSELLNEYLEQMTQAIFENGGTVDKFMGDAVLALFGAPEEITPNEQVRRAIAAARDMYARLDLLNQSWISQGIGEVKFRCGIHQGTAVVGLFGGDHRADYTAIGPSVNIAARIQEAADPDAILVSAAVADYLAEEEIIKFSPLKLKGIDETVLTFGVKSRHPEQSPDPQLNSLAAAPPDAAGNRAEADAAD